jgi:hypothetical protein
MPEDHVAETTCHLGHSHGHASKLYALVHESSDATCLAVLAARTQVGDPRTQLLRIFNDSVEGRDSLFQRIDAM